MVDPSWVLSLIEKGQLVLVKYVEERLPSDLLEVVFSVSEVNAQHTAFTSGADDGGPAITHFHPLLNGLVIGRGFRTGYRFLLDVLLKYHQLRLLKRIIHVNSPSLCMTCMILAFLVFGLDRLVIVLAREVDLCHAVFRLKFLLPSAGTV